ncbi:Hypothetical predicted protein [Mytilus galloprovincialis]|uniref:SUEL-type lectin domain-containing protein n=1 Tax=Mytilus galloprovincialis TaxID=29158 RepID=A0A8B6G411_MYTGA|nr:Hypothetical predicted protein [Mytilus galloprovincialis]
MAKLWIHSVWEILFFIQAIESLTITLCENSELGYKNVTCPKDETLSLKALTYGESSCQDTNNSNICHSTINAYFQTHCLGQNSCILQVDKLFKKDCQRPPRRLKVNFKCFFFWLFDRYVYTCANSLVEVNCPPSNYKEAILIENVKSYSDDSRCGSIDTLSAKRRLVALCNDKRRCVPDATRQSSLFHERYAMLSYLCKGPTAPLTTERIQPISPG